MQTTAEITLQNIWDAVHRSKDELHILINEKIQTVQISIKKMEGSMSSICDQITELGQRVSTNEDNVEDLTKRVQTLEKENAYLKDKVDDAENRSRACNLRFINIPEEAEGRDAVGFMAHLIPLLLGKENFQTPLRIERAHRTSSSTYSGSRAKPRPLLVKFLSFQDKIRILRFAKEKKALIYQGTRVHIFPDFSADLVKRRRQFDAVKEKLREKGIKYAMRYPCTLRIYMDGTFKDFGNPADAINYTRHDESFSSAEP